MKFVDCDRFSIHNATSSTPKRTKTKLSSYVLFPSYQDSNNFHFCILGVFNKSIFFRLDRICEDCYSLFREVELHSLCKWVSRSNRFVKKLYRILFLQIATQKKEKRFVSHFNLCHVSRNEYPIILESKFYLPQCFVSGWNWFNLHFGKFSLSTFFPWSLWSPTLFFLSRTFSTLPCKLF